MQIRTHQLPITGRDAIDLVTHALAEGFTLRKLAGTTEDAEDDIDIERARAVASEDAGLVVLCAQMVLAASEAATWVSVHGADLWVLVQAAGEPTPTAPIVISLDCPPSATNPCTWDTFGEDGDRFAVTAEAALLPYLRTMLAAISE